MNSSYGLPRLTIRQVNRLLDDKIISVQDLCRYCYALAVSGEKVWNLNAFSQLVSQDEILQQAQESDERRRNGQALSPLDGIPISIKANLAVASQQLTAGSRILGAAAQREEDSATTAGYTADVCRDLQRSGAILMGVTNMDEFGMGSLGTNVFSSSSSSSSQQATTTPTRNPLPNLHALQSLIESSLSSRHTGSSEMEHIQQMVQSSMDTILELHQQVAQDNSHETTSDASCSIFSTGGSSCGSAASVAHGSSLVSLGSDTGGSVRLPASWCGVVGLKPSYGRLSRHGLVSYASSLDTVGVLAPSADCAALAFAQLVQQPSKEEIAYTRRIVDSTHSSPQQEFRVLTNLHDSNDDNDSSRNDSLLEGIRIGLPEAFSVEECPTDIRIAWSQCAQVLQSHGATVETVPATILSPHVLQNSLAAYYVLVCAEASSNLARYDGFRYGVGASDSELDSILHDYCQATNSNGGEDGKTADLSLLEWQYAATRTKGFGPEVIRRILCGTAVLSSDRFHTYYEAAAKLRAVTTQQLHSCLLRPADDGKNGVNGGGEDSKERNLYDMLLVPTNLYPPPRLDNDQRGSCGNNNNMDPTEMIANDIMTVPASLAGLPAVSVPFGNSLAMTENDDSGAACFFRPGMQLIGARHQEDRILQVAAVLDDSK